MKKWEKEILQKQIQDEQKVVSRLKAYYKNAIEEVNNKIQVLMSKEQTQSVIYQLKYQQELEKQLSEIYGKLSSNYYSTIDEYLTDCYEDTFYSTMYGLHKEGIPTVIPFDQKQMAQMAAQSEYEGIKLSQNLYVNNTEVAHKVRQEISKGIAMNSSYADIARNVAKKSEASINQAYRITRTEGHRIQNEVKFKTLNKVRDEKGADIVKQWDSTIDKKTRPDHVALDGQLREIDQPFKIPGKGHTALYPGGFGIASEDINCRCVCLQRARWALDKSELDKLVGDLDGATDEQLQAWADKLGVSKDDLIKSSNGIIESDGSINHSIKAQNYNQFKKKYETKAKIQTKQLQSQLDIVQKEKEKLLSKYHGKEDSFYIFADYDEYVKYEDLTKQIESLQNQLGIDTQAATKATKATMPVSNNDAIVKNAKGFDTRYHERMNFNRDKWDNDLSARERSAVVDYTGSYYREMNAALREGRVSGSSYESKIKYCTSALEKCEIAEDTKLWRGMGSKNTLASTLGVSRSEIHQMLDDGSIVGQRFVEKGFVSTGVIESSGWNKDVFLEIIAPKGTKGMYVAPISNFKSENELLLQRNTTFEILKAERDASGRYKLIVLVVDQTI